VLAAFADGMGEADAVPQESERFSTLDECSGRSGSRLADKTAEFGSYS
jgi:hypothetical protein